MSSSQKPKYMGKPFIKKIYETHKKWLGGESKSHKQDKNESAKRQPPVIEVVRKPIPDYENVEVKSDSITSDKLRIVINSFDKILDEYSSPSLEPPEVPVKVVPPPRKHPKKLAETQPKPPEPTPKITKIPKLVKAKTCSIIESKCILKKNAPSSLQNCNPAKTKSMTNLDLNATPVKIVPISIDPPPLPKSAPPSMKPTVVVESPGKVKELVKRINSLSDSTTIEHPAPAPALSKAVSTTNLSLSKKHGSVSKIPVNSSLRKSFPSTPCHLDKLDSNGSAPGGKKVGEELSKAKSVQNLAKPRLSLPGASSADVSKARSVQNLSKPRIPKSEQDKVKGGVKTVPKNLRTVTTPPKSLPKQSQVCSPNRLSVKSPGAGVKKANTLVKQVEDASKRDKKDKTSVVAKKPQEKIPTSRTVDSSPKKVTPKVVTRKLTPAKNKPETVVVQDKLDKKFYLNSDFIVKDPKKKNLDYNSDDSGNISNEVDCDESTSSSVRSRTSTESLPSVLDSKVELPRDISVVVADVPNKVGFEVFYLVLNIFFCLNGFV